MTTRTLVLSALFTALLCALAIVPPIPMPLVPVPLTLQTLVVMLAGLIIGPRAAGLSVLLYVVLAAIGFPVLPGARGGLAVLLGPTGGFLLGMIPGAMVTGWLAKVSLFGGTLAPSTIQTNDRAWVPIARNTLAALVGGVAVVYLVGVPWLSIVTGMSLVKALNVIVVFLPGDFIKAVVAAYLAHRVRRFLV
jgi:biotin transport system substrate-specific component